MLASFFLVAIAMFSVGCAAAVLTAVGVFGDDGRWMAIHLILLGGVSQLILGAAQFFSTAFLATDPPPSQLVRAQLIAWNLGVFCVVVSVPTRITPLVDLGGLSIVGGLALLVVALRRLEQRSLQTARWAIRWYYACAAFLAIGTIAGVALAHGVAWPHGDLLTAHLALNVAGWLGTAIVGTLHTFFPSLTHGLLQHPRLQGPTFVAWTTGVALLAFGAAFDWSVAIVVGWIVLTFAAALLSTNLVHSAITAAPPITLATRLVGTAQVFLPAGLGVALAMIAIEGPDPSITGDWRVGLAVLIGLGWVGMTVAGSMIHLLTVLNRVRNFLAAMPDPHPAYDTTITAAVATSIVLLAFSAIDSLDRLAPFAAAALLVASLPVFARIGSLAARAYSLAPWFKRPQSDR